MNAHHGDSLPPELLAAYADGELAPAEQRRVEAWLAGHPEARADVEAQRRLSGLFEDTAPRPPADDRWAEVLTGVERCLASPPVGRPAWGRRAAVAAIGAAAAAALLVLAVRPPPGDAPQAVPEEPWPVVSAEDIDIVSMDDRDREKLVIGEPPVNEPLELLSADEVKVQKLPDAPGRVGKLHRIPGSDPPLIVVSLDEEPEEDP
jgi:hypothetical protein